MMDLSDALTALRCDLAMVQRGLKEVQDALEDGDGTFDKRETDICREYMACPKDTKSSETS